jgi:hypothetical protein
MQITSSLATLLGLSQTAIALKADLPVAYTGQIGMFDIALYSNNRAGQPPPAEGESVDDVNCVPHYDPGLFSISIFSNHEGLQLYDPLSNTWCAAPVNTIQGQQEFGVLWLGKAAADVSQGRWRAGVHRVIYPAISGPRLTMWYEMCTVAQVNGPDDSLPMPQGEVELPNVTGYGKMLYVSPGETQSDVLRRIERRRGLPMSKVPRLADKFKVRANHIYLSNLYSSLFRSVVYGECTRFRPNPGLLRNGFAWADARKRTICFCLCWYIRLRLIGASGATAPRSDSPVRPLRSATHCFPIS